MSRSFLAVLSAACALVGGTLAPNTAESQEWNDPRTRALVERATRVRQQQLADTGLVDYRARAHGYLTFLAQVGEGYTEPPRVVKADELAVEVYWKAPDLSKQRIIGRRDTLALPTDIQYHQDHLGIVQNNFPSIIRLGEGDEVSDVPHPLSPDGLGAYDFAIRDSVELILPGDTIALYQIRVRPKDETAPRVIGAVYVDRENAQVVRMAFSFTRAAHLDRQLDDISIVLENTLIEGSYWLPGRQEIEIRRSGTWLDYPARGIIRGRWEICCYDVNVGLPVALFRGPEIVQASPSVMREYRFTGRILDSLPPDVRVARPEELARVQEEAREMVRADALARTRSTALSARGISEFIRFNRVEGLALGAGLRWRFGGGVHLAIAGRWGFADEEAKGRLALGWHRASGAGVEIFAHHGFREAGDVRETSGLVNSLAAQEFGTDYTDPYGVTGGGLAVDLGRRLGLLWRIEAAYEEQEPLEVHATPARGDFEPTVPAWPLDVWRGTLAVERSTALGPWGTEIRGAAELRAGVFETRGSTLLPEDGRFGRAFATVNIERPLGRHRLVSWTAAGAVAASTEAPPQEWIWLGGPITGPGYDFHSLAATFAAAQRLEWRFPIPFAPIPLARFGRAPAQATLAPYVHAVWLGGESIREEGLYPAVGVGLLTLFDLLRVDVARGLEDGRWTFSLDVSRDFWGIL